MCGARRQESPPPCPVYDECVRADSVRSGVVRVWTSVCTVHRTRAPVTCGLKLIHLAHHGTLMRGDETYDDNRIVERIRQILSRFSFLSVQMLEAYSPFDIDTGDDLVISYLFHDFDVSNVPSFTPCNDPGENVRTGPDGQGY